MVAKEVTSLSQEDYWKMKLPNVPIPNLISNNLFHSISDNKEKAIIAQPNEKNGDGNANVGHYLWDWKYKEDKDKVNVGHYLDEWKHKEDHKDNAKDGHYLVGWKYKEDKDKAIVAQPNEKNGDGNANVGHYLWDWKYKEDKDKVNVGQPNKENGDGKANVGHYLWDWKYKEDNNGKASVGHYLWDWKYKEDKKEKMIVAQPNEEQNGDGKVNVGHYLWNWKCAKDNDDKANVGHYLWDWKYKKDRKERDVKDKSSVSNHQGHSHLNGGEDKGMVVESVFFMEENLKLGKKLRHDFLKGMRSNFLPRDVASSMPFAVDKYPEILDRFSVDPNSAEATRIKETLSLCFERPHAKKENRTCAQSMEDVVDFVVKELGTNNLKLATMSASEDKLSTGMQDYWITNLNRLNIPNGDGVACHKMDYPYAIYWCHHQEDIGQYSVTLVNSDGISIDTTAVCHYDTYAWDVESPALRYLGIHPGDATLCHFSLINDMFWSLSSGKVSAQ